MTYRRYYSLLYSAAADAVADRGGHLVYENRSALSGLSADQPGRYGGAEPVDLVHAAAAVRIAERCPDPSHGTVLLGFRRPLDRVNGFSVAVDWPRRVQYFRLDGW